jgi:hypothetical protein
VVVNRVLESIVFIANRDGHALKYSHISPVFLRCWQVKGIASISIAL